jgi:hypothetical protein
MPAELWADFVGGFYQTRSTIMGADQAINVYTETREVPGSPKQVTMYGTPGRTLETTLTQNRCRGWFTQDGQTWVVFGSTLYERTAPATYVSRGTVFDDGLDVFFASNGLGGDQLGITGGGNLYVLNILTNAFTIVTLPFPNPVMIVFQDAYGLINQLNTPTFWFSHLEDLTTWDALDFLTRSNTSDNVVGLAISRDRLFVLGSKVINLFFDSGNALNPWVPYPGTSTQVGALSAYAIRVHNDIVYYLGQSSQGDPKVVGTKTDLQVQTISTPPIVDFFAGCSKLNDVTLLIYSQGGHTFVTFTAPSSPADIKTYAYDVLEKKWAARAGFDQTTGRYTRWGAAGVTATGNTVLTGDPVNGNVYTLDLTTYTDNGGILKRERMAPYPSAANQWGFINSFELGTQAGVGLPSGQGVAPAVEFQLSRDGAQTFVSAGAKPLGAQGNYLTRTIWRQLGRARLDRLVMRTIQTDPVPCVWGPGAWVDIAPGTGQL